MDSIHKDLFPLDASDWYGTVLIALGLMIAASGGIGGGGIVVPLLILVYGFHPKHAIALSNFTILGSSITNMVMNVVKSHPTANRPLVDWDLILVMEPLTMIGAVVGAIVGKILPDWILTLSLVTLLAHTTYTTLEKAKSQYEKETKQLLANESNGSKSLIRQVIEEDDEENETEGFLDDDVDHHDGKTAEKPEGKDYYNLPEHQQEKSSFKTNQKSGNDNSNKTENSLDDDEAEPETDVFEKEINIPNPFTDEAARKRNLHKLLEEESKTPMERVYVMCFMVVVVVGLNLLKGGSRFPIGH